MAVEQKKTLVGVLPSCAWSRINTLIMCIVYMLLRGLSHALRTRPRAGCLSCRLVRTRSGVIPSENGQIRSLLCTGVAGIRASFLSIISLLLSKTSVDMWICPLVNCLSVSFFFFLSSHPSFYGAVLIICHEKASAVLCPARRLGGPTSLSHKYYSLSAGCDFRPNRPQFAATRTHHLQEGVCVRGSCHRSFEVNH